MSNLSTLPKGDSAWLLRKAIERIMQQVSVLETNIGSSTTGNSANTQIIFNDAGTLRGDTGLVFNKTTDALTVAGLVTAGSATITGDLTVDTSTLKVDSTNNRVGIGTASPTVPLYVTGNNATATAIMQDETNGAKLRLLANSINFDITNGGGGGEISVSGANPLTFKTNGTERARIDSSGNVGVGVTPSAWSSISGGAFQTFAGATLYSYGTDNFNLAQNAFYNSAGGLSDKYIRNGAATRYYQASGSHQWFNATSGTAGDPITFTQAMTLDASGNLLVGVTSANANGGVLQLKSGITFPATQVASSDANTLDDYEEGTFTPSVGGTSTAGSATYARRLGRYTKVGNLVTVQIYLSWSGGTGTGDLAFSGLPFTIANNANEYAVAAIGVFDSIALTASNVPSIAGSPNTTIFNLNQFPVGGGANSGVPYDAAGAIIMTSTYIV